jgi:hypothetical protein
MRVANTRNYRVATQLQAGGRICDSDRFVERTTDDIFRTITVS